ncbi:hypothetical protein BpHYR1_044266 [Brachionus plicatilis]|uniref:Uncharacterized protein n=1 Tax=Brachionus plicatilis TaxID=10195 RepID=A0A3M7SUV7_BRAPC|nr:hypothetical protein BpHYR1_044266 [Brachionus plicatilis]
MMNVNLVKCSFYLFKSPMTEHVVSVSGHVLFYLDTKVSFQLLKPKYQCITLIRIKLSFFPFFCQYFKTIAMKKKYFLKDFLKFKLAGHLNLKLNDVNIETKVKNVNRELKVVNSIKSSSI